MDDNIVRHRSSFRGSHPAHVHTVHTPKSANKNSNFYMNRQNSKRRSPANSPIGRKKKLSTNSSGGAPTPAFNFASSHSNQNLYHNHSDYESVDYDYDEKLTSNQSNSSSVDYDNQLQDWVRCKECQTGKTIWYHKETLQVSFENPLFAKNRIDNDAILSQSIAREDIDDALISKYILSFDSQEWNFRNDYVDTYRAQASAIDHTQLLPHPNDLVFPEFFSNHTIPKKESFVATILPPIDFNIPSTSWKMAINVSQTTASDIIEKFVKKINSNSNSVFESKQFVLKVIGCEEYILYDHKKLIIDYEAVRRAVRNEDDVTFGLVHRPDLSQIISEAMDLQKEYIKSFALKYPLRVVADGFLKYERKGCGDGKSLIELKLELIHRQQRLEREQKEIYSNKPPSPTPNIQESHTGHYTLNGNIKNKSLKNKPLPKMQINKPLPPNLNIKVANKMQQRDLPSMHTQSHSANVSQLTHSHSHRMSVSDHRRLHRRANTISNALKLGKHSGLSNVSPYGSEPSLRDSAWLRNHIKGKNSVGDYSAVLLEDHTQLYRFRVSNLTNVMKLPRFINMKSVIKRVIVRHELWIGELDFKECVSNTPNIARVSDNMKFADWFTSKHLKYCDLPREACLSLTVYGLSAHEKKKSKVVETPLAYVRLPLIDHRHRLVNGKYTLNVWPIPVFVKTKHGLKSDQYSHGQSFRFRGPTRDRFIGRNHTRKDTHTHTSTATATENESILDHFNKLGHDICQLSIEFTRRDFDVVAPLIAHTHTQKQAKNTQSSGTDDSTLSDNDWKSIHNIIMRDLICDMSDKEASLIWRARDQLVSMPRALPVFLRCVDWRNRKHRCTAYQYLRQWQPLQYLEDALELLGPEFMDQRVREYGVLCIANMHDSDLQRYLLQLCQCLKFELQHSNALIRLLMRRSLQNPYQIGHFFFWHLQSEYHNLETQERFGLYQEEYLLHCTSHSRELLQQINLMRALEHINRRVYALKKKGEETVETVFKEMLSQLNRVMPTIISLPLNPRWRCTHLIVDKCKIFSSAQVPLLLCFKNVDPLAQNIHVLFKCGDDLRQDILTLQVFRVMDKVWLDRGLNLRLITYDVVATGHDCGMIEIVLNSKTTNHIHVTQGGGPQKGCRDETTHLNWLNSQNLNERKLSSARYNYARSCAGYCVATYVLGIGDRHPDNIMLRQNGVIFHIDFGHFLGNFKVKKVANYSWKRERTPFVFLPSMKYVINNGHKDKDLYTDFEQWFVDAYMALRIRHRLLFNLFQIMSFDLHPMPELICKSDLVYLRDQLHLNDIAQDKIHKHCKKVIKQCLNDKSRILDNIFHAVKHT